MKVLLILEENLEKSKQNFSRRALFHIKTRVSLTYFVSYCLEKLIFDSNSPQTTFKFNFFDPFVNSKTFLIALS